MSANTVSLNTISDPQAQNDNCDEKVELDDIFGLEDVFFKVENTIFKVPKHGLMYPGSYFMTLFMLPQPEDGETPIEGTDLKHPIILQGISKSHFKGFLKFLYPLIYQSAKTAAAETYSNLSISTIQESGNGFDDWVGILRLATMWDFPLVRKATIRHISGMLKSQNGLTTWEKMAVAKEFHVKQWLLDEYKDLITKNLDVPLDVDYLLSGGMSLMDIMKVFQIRESISRTLRCTKCRRAVSFTSGSAYSENIDQEILTKFAQEFMYVDEEVEPPRQSTIWGFDSD